MVGLSGCIRAPQEQSTSDDVSLAAEDGPTPISVPATESGEVDTINEADLADESQNTQTEGVMAEAQQATIETSKGSITVNLFPDEAPNTVANFVEKAKNGFYEGLTFHRVEDWVVQGGDPEGTGRGGGDMPTELNEVPFGVGSLGVARGPNIEVSNDSQFFICTQDCSWLTGEYTNFGEVTEGMDVVNAIEIGDTIESISVEG